MRVIPSSQLESRSVQGEKGTVEIQDFMKEPSLIMGLRRVGANSSVPKKVHSHPLRQAMYVIRGKGTVDNGKERRRFQEGDFMFFEGEEEHYFHTEEEVLMLEVQFE
ncbi:MAG: cupin domain-containing protein [Thermoplasmatota archaeon]